MLKKFHHYRDIFKTCDVRDGFSLPHQYALDHYPCHIQEFGAPNGLCSSITESKHIKAVKELWRRSSEFEALGQMLFTNQQLDKLAAAWNNFEAHGMLQGSLLTAIIQLFEQLAPVEQTVEDPGTEGHGAAVATAGNDSDDDESGPNQNDKDAGAVEGPHVLSSVVLAHRAGTTSFCNKHGCIY